MSSEPSVIWMIQTVSCGYEDLQACQRVKELFSLFTEVQSGRRTEQQPMRRWSIRTMSCCCDRSRRVRGFLNYPLRNVPPTVLSAQPSTILARWIPSSSRSSLRHRYYRTEERRVGKE